MAKYRKVYESDFQPIADAISLFGDGNMRNPKKALKSISTVLPSMLQLFELIQSRPVMEDEE